MSAMPSHMELWHRAADQFPNDNEARGRRYVELMREEGLIVPREPGDDSPLFLCGYDPRPAPEAS